MAGYFKCKQGCVKCCEDVTFAVGLSLDDIVRISRAQELSVTGFFDEAQQVLQAEYQLRQPMSTLLAKNHASSLSRRG